MARLKLLLLGLLSIFVFGAAGFIFVVPSEYALSGKIVDEKGEGIEGIVAKAKIAEVTTDVSGAYSLKGLRKGEAIDIVVPEDYEKPVFSPNYESATRAGLKTFRLEGDLTLQQSVVGFVKELLTNEKYKRHNIIWTYLDAPSKKIYGSVSAYEGFFKAVLGFYSEGALKDFRIDKEHITIRDEWKSPQGTVYKDVYEVPVERSLNDGTAESTTIYVFKVGGKWKIATTFTKKRYKEVKSMLEELGEL